MFKSLSAVSLAALMALTAPVLAQDTTTDSNTDSNTEAEAPKNENLLDLGQPVNAGPQLGERYSKETHGDWELACIKTQAENDPCSLLQILNGPEGAPMAEVSLFRLENGGQAVAGATIIVPLETLLPAQLTISVDGAPGKRYNYSFCNPIGCVAQIGFTADDIAAFKKGNKAILTLVPAPAPDQQINLDLSLSGFTAGFDVVDVVANN